MGEGDDPALVGGGDELRRVLAANLGASESLLSISGVRVEARCRGDVLDVRVLRSTPRGERVIRDDELLRVARHVVVPFARSLPLTRFWHFANAARVTDGE